MMGRLACHIWAVISSFNPCRRIGRIVALLGLLAVVTAAKATSARAQERLR
jgi:hypothetical protein